MKKCPKCGAKNLLAVEYGYGQKYRYDGVSEWWCQNGCGSKFGRFCGRELTGHEVEPPYCDGTKPHPQVIDIKELE